MCEILATENLDRGVSMPTDELLGLDCKLRSDKEKTSVSVEYHSIAVKACLIRWLLE